MSKGVEARFLITMDSLPLGPRRTFSHCKDKDVDNDKMHCRLGASVPPPSYLLYGLLSRLGRFVRRIKLHNSSVTVRVCVCLLVIRGKRIKDRKYCEWTRNIARRPFFSLALIYPH